MVELTPLRRLTITTSPTLITSDVTFDALVRLAARVTSAPIAVIAVVNGGQEWSVLTRIGLGGIGIEPHDPLWHDASMVAEALVVDDVTKDSRFEASELVESGGVRMFASVPLRDSDRTVLGALCVADTTPRTLRPGEVGGLRDLALQAEMRIRLEVRLSGHSLVDAITGLPNRNAWESEISADLSRAKRTGKPVCVAMVEIDNYRRYVEQNGDAAVDRLLSRCANAWRHALRATDTLVRYDEQAFAVILPECPIEIAAPQLERLRHLVPDGQTCSIGVASWNGTETTYRLVTRVLTALEVARTQGRDRVITDLGLSDT